MIAKFLFNYTAGLPCRLIRKRYLERYHLGFLFGYRFYLHRFVGGDADEETHNHPFDALSVVLCGSYLEELATGFKAPQEIKHEQRTVHWFNRVRPSTFHRIVKTKKETWTLFITAKSTGDGWGFLCSNPIRFAPMLSHLGPWHLTAPKGRQAKRAAFDGT